MGWCSVAGLRSVKAAVRGCAAQVSDMPGKKAAAPNSSESGNVKTPTHQTMART